MDYFALVKKAFLITIKNRYLWLFGFFAGASGGGLNLYSGGSGRTSDYQGKTDYGYNQFAGDVGNFMASNWIWITLIGIFFLGVILFFIVMSILSQGALIGSVDKIDKNQKSGIRDGFKMGKNKFWRILGIGILMGIIMFLAIAILGTPIFFLFFYKMFLRGIILVLIALIILIPLSIVINYLTIYGYRFAVLENKKIKDSLKSAYALFLGNFWPSIVMGLIMILIAIISMMAAFLILVLVGLPYIFLGIMAYTAVKWVGVGIVVILGLLTLFVVMALYGAMLAAYQSSLWTLMYKELLKNNK